MIPFDYAVIDYFRHVYSRYNNDPPHSAMKMLALPLRDTIPALENLKNRRILSETDLETSFLVVQL